MKTTNYQLVMAWLCIFIIFLTGINLGQEMGRPSTAPVEANSSPAISDFEWGRIDGYYRVKPGGPSTYGTDMQSIESRSARFDDYLKGYWSGFSERVMEKKD